MARAALRMTGSVFTRPIGEIRTELIADGEGGADFSVALFGPHCAVTTQLSEGAHQLYNASPAFRNEVHATLHEELRNKLAAEWRGE